MDSGFDFQFLLQVDVGKIDKVDSGDFLLL